MMNPIFSQLLADLYQFTMLQTYLEQEMNEIGVFERFARKPPLGSNFMVAAGLKQALSTQIDQQYLPEA